MKLSKLSTEEVFSKLSDLLIPVSNILEDEKLEKEVKKIGELYKDGCTVLKINAAVTKNLLPLVFKHRKNDLFEIISIMSGKDIDTIAKQNFMLTIKDIADLFDKDLLDFFISLRAQAKSE